MTKTKTEQTERESKLPKWAQRELANLRAERDHWKNQAEQVAGPITKAADLTPGVWRHEGLDYQQMLAPEHWELSGSVTWVLSDGTRVELAEGSDYAGSLRLMARRRLVIRPHSSNMVTITDEAY